MVLGMSLAQVPHPLLSCACPVLFDVFVCLRSVGAANVFPAHCITGIVCRVTIDTSSTQENNVAKPLLIMGRFFFIFYLYGGEVGQNRESRMCRGHWGKCRRQTDRQWVCAVCVVEKKKRKKRRMMRWHSERAKQGDEVGPRQASVFALASSTFLILRLN